MEGDGVKEALRETMLTDTSAPAIRPEAPVIRTIERLELKPGDILVVYCDELSSKHQSVLREQLSRWMKFTVPVLSLPTNSRLEIISPTALEEQGFVAADPYKRSDDEFKRRRKKPELKG